MYAKKAINASILVMLWCIVTHMNSMLPPIRPFTNATSYQEGFGTADDFLFRAARSGDVSEIDTLRGKGVSVNARMRLKQTALMIAARQGHVKFCAKLLARGADTGLVDQKGDTALMYAVRGKKVAPVSEDLRVKIAQLLLEHGADPSRENDQKSSPIWHAFSHQQMKLAQCFLRHKLRENGDFYLNKILFFISFRGYVSGVNLLLVNGLDPCSVNEQDQTVLDEVLKITKERKGNLKKWKDIETSLKRCINMRQKETATCLGEVIKNLPVDLARCIAQFMYFLPFVSALKNN